MNKLRVLFFVVVTALSGCGNENKVAQGIVKIEQEISNACTQSSIEVQSRILADDLFIDSQYLKFLAGTTTDRGHILEADLSRVVAFALEKGLTSLETDLQFKSTHSVSQTGNITRISVKPAHDPACKAFRYPWWEMPELRKLGLDPDHCVAVENVEKSTASTRILARPTKLDRISDAGGQYEFWRIEVLAGTAKQLAEQNSSIRLIDHVSYSRGSAKSWSGWTWGCPDNDARARALNAAVAGKGNRMLHRPEVVVVQNTGPAIQEAYATNTDVAQLRWIVREHCAGGSNTYDAEGTIWVQDVRIDKTLRIALHVLKGSRLLVAPMPIEFDRALFNNQSVLHFGKGFVVNLTRGFKNDELRRLVVFDENLNHVATWRLSAEQRESLVPPEPASVNWCRDPLNDQFQRSNSPSR